MKRDPWGDSKKDTRFRPAKHVTSSCPPACDVFTAMSHSVLPLLRCLSMVLAAGWIVEFCVLCFLQACCMRNLNVT